MAEHQSIELFFDSTKSTLPAKIIRLRKISQENHVRRMKLAYQRKEMQGLSDFSSFLSPSFPRKTCRSKSSFSSPTNIQSCINDIPSRRKKFELLPARTKSDLTSTKYLDSYKKCVQVKKNKKALTRNKITPSSTFSKGNYSDFSNSNRNKTTPENTNCAEFQKEIVPFSTDELASHPHNNKVDEKNTDELLLKKSPITLEVQNNDIEKKINKNLLAKKKPSRIPIWKPNLKRKNNFTKTKCPYKLENVNEIPEKHLESMSKGTQKQIKELSFKQITDKDEDDNGVEETNTFTNLTYNCSENDPYKSFYHGFCEEEFRNERFLVNKWMNGTVNTTENHKNSSESSIISLFRNLITESPPREKKTLNIQRKEKTPEPVDIFNGAGICEKYGYTTDISESENSSEACTCYEIEETANKRSTRKMEKSNELKEANSEVESTITVPSDKDLEIADHRDPVYRNLPDYPDTPYNLRYNRYTFKDFK